MTIEAVLFDWGGTLTPWRTIDVPAIWAEVARTLVTEGDGAAGNGARPDAASLAERLAAADAELWQRAKTDYRAFTLDEVFAQAGTEPTPAALATLHEQWVPATHTDPQAPDMLAALRARGIRVGILSNTPWPRAWHDHWLQRDGVLDLLHGAVYTSDLSWNKPHPDTFHAAMRAVEVSDPRRCIYVGDRLFEDVWGAQRLGMRAVHIPHSDIPADQRGHSQGQPDATIQELDELPALVEEWHA
ncbi:HAD family hydrolase [Lipingzhangella sp. LS1_29]|uniref:HAD family hydrolase n=1 Tax=Lipingzhangella rawalii TaxID=2055835 RepID=A0ABU2H1H8_9ACTN|nr:HAD family hydrolase [Lipingzhangella rawalii]MDS1269172.1 HAD family hydrolase [Lipingzhangella rawalii]